MPLGTSCPSTPGRGPTSLSRHLWGSFQSRDQGFLLPRGSSWGAGEPPWNIWLGGAELVCPPLDLLAPQARPMRGLPRAWTFPSGAQGEGGRRIWPQAGVRQHPASLPRVGPSSGGRGAAQLGLLSASLPPSFPPPPPAAWGDHPQGHERGSCPGGRSSCSPSACAARGLSCHLEGRLGRQWARVPVLALGLAGLWQSATSPSGAWRETSRGAGADSLLSLCPSGTPGPTRASGSMSVGGTEVTTSSWPQRPPWLPSGGPSPALLRGRPLPGPGPFALLPASVLLVWPGWPLTPPPH